MGDTLLQAFTGSRKVTDLVTAESGSDSRAKLLHEDNRNVNRLCNHMYVHEPQSVGSGALRTFLQWEKNNKWNAMKAARAV